MTDNARQIKRISVGLLIAIVGYALANSLMNVLLNDVIDAFSVSGTGQGALNSMISVGTLAAVATAPLLQGRFRKTAVIVCSCLLLAFGSFLTGEAHSFGVLIAVCMVLGAGLGWLDVYLSSAMIDAHPRDGPRWLGILHGFFGLGGLAAPFLITALLKSVTWRGVYFAFAAILLFAAALVFFLFRSPAGAPAQKAEEKLTSADARAYLSSRRSRLLVVCAVLAFAMQTGLISWIVRYFRLSFGSDAYSATAVSLYWVGLTISRFLAPHLPVKPMKLYTVGAALLAAAMLLGIFAHSAVWLCAAVAVSGFTNGPMIPLLLGESALGWEGKSTLATAAVMLSMCLARIATPLLLAWFTNVLSPNAGMLAVPVMGVLGIFFGLSALACSPRVKA